VTRAYLRDITEACNAIRDAVAGMDLDAYKARVDSAVVLVHTDC